MPILASDNRREWTPAPEGLSQGVCVDVIDLGIVEGQFGPKHKVRLRFQLEAICKDDNKRFQVSKMYTLSLDHRANLRKDIETWGGHKLTDDQLKGFDLEKLIGVNAQLQIIHNVADEGRVYANIQTIIPLGKGERRISPQDYIRVKDRERTMDKPLTPEEDGSDLPF